LRRPILLFTALLVALLAALAATMVLIQPPEVRVSSKPGQFNAAHAKGRLGFVIRDYEGTAERPHPADTEANDQVRDRLIVLLRGMGLTPIVRDQFACNTIYKQRGVSCARVRNVIVALGPPAGKAVLLNAHYDSTPVGPAAGDDGAGVATLMEVASILKNERLKRPVILLFNEGEELGLIGARAFIADPLSQRVDSLINLEARGVSGPVTMFETSLPNGPAVRAFAKAVDRPFANSLATDFYRQLPNYTDVNSFSERDWTTLNFAMIGNETRYHSPGDDLAALDLRSVQHMGDQTLAVTRELAASPASGAGTLLFADIAGMQLVVIPDIVGFGLLGLLVIGFGVVAFRRGGMWRGLGLMLAAIVVSAALAWLCIFLMGVARPGSFWRAYPLWTQLAVYVCGLFGGVAALATVGRRLAIEQLRVSYWLAFLLLGVAVFFIAPGGVIYFLLPPLVMMVGILVKQERIAAFFAALVLWLTFGEMLALLGELMNNGPFFIFAPLALLIAMPWLIECKDVVDQAGRKAVVLVSAVLAVIALAAVAAAPAYSADRQQRFLIQHATNEVTGRAYWVVVNDHSPLPNGYGGIAGWRWDELPYIEGKRWIAPAATLADLRPPQLEVVSNALHGKIRTVSFRIRPNGAESVTLIGTKDAGIVSAGMAGFVRPIAPEAKGKYYLQCYGRSCDNAVMQLSTSVRQRMRFTLVGSKRGLPATAKGLLDQRPANARPQYSPDATLTISRIWL
jgi:hypothetical protein